MKICPKISVITPSFNQAKYLEQTIRSVVEQNYPNLEYLILDGGSADGSAEIIKKYANRYPEIIKWRSRPDKGQVAAINEGLQKATGDIVGYLNSDDYFLPGALEKVGSAFTANPKATWLTAPCLVSGEDILGRIYTFFVTICLTFYHSWLLEIVNCISQPSTFWKKGVLSRIGSFNSDYKYAFDYEYWTRLNQLVSPLVLSTPLSVYRIHNDSKSRNFYTTQLREELHIARTQGSHFRYCLHWLLIYLIVIPIYKLARSKSR